MVIGAAPPRCVLDLRRAGVLLHPTSLPSATLGDDAMRFLDFLQAGGFSVWQMLPLGPVGMHASPYSPDSAFAGNPRLIPHSRCGEVIEPGPLQQFRAREAAWLEDYALFKVIQREVQGQPWWDWPDELRHRDMGALQAFAQAHRPAIQQCVWEQFQFDQCWRALRSEASARGILLYGDLPMFVVANSADVWANPDIFRLDEQGQATHVAGVPPDAFTELGQCWDNPVYDWERLRDRGFDWWLRRVAHECNRFDLLRWDHFRGLAATWEIPVPGGGRPARPAEGAWHEVPGRALLEFMERKLGSLPLVAENLGIITPEVEQLRHDFGLPGMHVLQFAFDGNEHNPHLLENHEVQGVAYTGTHDNDTSAGWYSSLPPELQTEILKVLGQPADSMPEALVHLALASVCQLAIIPLQDLLGLGSEARMNVPGQAQGQWRWTFNWADLTPELAKHWRHLVQVSGRVDFHRFADGIHDVP